MGKPRSDLDQHARNEKKLLIKSAIKKIQHAFALSPNTQCLLISTTLGVINAIHNDQRPVSVSQFI